MMFEYAEDIERLADIKVVGVGGAGGNAVDRMVTAGLLGVEFLALNTDLQALQDSRAHHCMQIGAQLTKGLGSGGDPAKGQAAAEEDREAIAAALRGADMVFVTAGMGGGTGTGAAPIVAEIARKQGSLTVGIVTRPFSFEGLVRRHQADEGIARLRAAVDTLIIIPNQRLLEVVPPTTSMQEAFRIADNVLYEATRGIYEIISRHDHVNLDFADVRSVMKDMGEAMMGTGRAEGQDRAVVAARAAISSPLLEDVNIAGSQAVLVNLLGREVGLHDTAAAMQFIQEAAGPQAHVIFGFGIEESMGETLQVTVIATGFQGAGNGRSRFTSAQVGMGLDRAVFAAAAPSHQAPAAMVEADPLLQAALDEPSAADVESLPDVFLQQDSAEPDPAEDAADWDSAPDLPAAQEAESQDLEFLSPVADEDGLRQAPFADLEWQEPDLPAVELRAMAAAAGEAAAAGPAFRQWDAPGTTRPQAARNEAPEPAAPEPARTESSVPFLRRVGTRNIGQVEVPDLPGSVGPLNPGSGGAGPLNPGSLSPGPLGQRQMSGFGTGSQADDLSAPAYTRKYMD